MFDPSIEMECAKLLLVLDEQPRLFIWKLLTFVRDVPRVEPTAPTTGWGRYLCLWTTDIMPHNINLNLCWINPDSLIAKIEEIVVMMPLPCSPGLEIMSESQEIVQTQTALVKRCHRRL
jgi:hypothetical protein